MTQPPPPESHPAPPAPAPASRGGGIGLAALAVAIVLVLLGLLQQVLATVLPSLLYDAGVDFRVIGTILGAGTVVLALLAIVAIVLGAIGVQPSRPRGRLAAAAALGIGAAHLLAAIVGLSAPLVLSLAMG